MSAEAEDGPEAPAAPPPAATTPLPAAPASPALAPSSPPATPPVAGSAPERSSTKRSSHLGTVVKLGFAGLVFGFLVWKGAIDPKKVGHAAFTASWLVQVSALLFASISIITIRWWLLLRLEKIEVSLVAALKLTLVGHFWNNVLPGAVTGDFVKMYYIGKLYPNLKAEAYTTVVIDRIVGLAALVFLSCGCALGNLDFIFAKGHEPLQYTFYGNALAAAGFAAGILFLVLGVGRKSSMADKLRQSLPWLESVRRGYRSLIRLGDNPKVLAQSFLLGVVSHALLVCVAIISGRALGETTMATATYYFVVPVGLFVNSVPIGFPGGIGAGEAAFDQLFKWAGGLDEGGQVCGGNVMLLLRVGQLIWAIVGAVVYVFDRKALTPQETPEPVAALAAQVFSTQEAKA